MFIYKIFANYKSLPYVVLQNEQFFVDCYINVCHIKHYWHPPIQKREHRATRKLQLFSRGIHFGGDFSPGAIRDPRPTRGPFHPAQGPRFQLCDFKAIIFYRRIIQVMLRLRRDALNIIKFSFISIIFGSFPRLRTCQLYNRPSAIRIYALRVLCHLTKEHA